MIDNISCILNKNIVFKNDILDRNFSVTDGCKEISSYMRGCKMTLIMHDVKMSL